MPLSTVLPPPESDSQPAPTRLESLRRLRLPREEPVRAQPRRRVRSAATVTGIALLIGVAIWIGLRSGATVEPRTAAPTTIPDAVASPRASSLTGTGYVVTRREYVDVGATVPGRITWMGVEEGDRVPAGTVLARLDDRELRAALSAARAAHATAEAQLAELRAGARPEEIEEARATVAEADAALRLARTTLARAERLAAQDVIAQQELDVARAEVERSESRREAATQRHALLLKGPRAESIAIAEADVARAAAAVEQAAVRLDETVIRAPFDGVVLEKLRELGDFVVPGGVDRRGSGSALFHVASSADPQVEVDVSEASIAQLAPGQPAEIVLDAVPGRTYHAAIAKIHPAANRQKATVKIELAVIDADSAMKPEMTAKVSFR
jgi:HlyD family secretion protein